MKSRYDFLCQLTLAPGCLPSHSKVASLYTNFESFQRDKNKKKDKKKGKNESSNETSDSEHDEKREFAVVEFQPVRFPDRERLQVWSGASECSRDNTENV